MNTHCSVLHLTNVLTNWRSYTTFIHRRPAKRMKEREMNFTKTYIYRVASAWKNLALLYNILDSTIFQKNNETNDKFRNSVSSVYGSGLYKT